MQKEHSLGLNKDLNIRFSKKEDIPSILEMVRALAEFEKLSHEVVATEEMLLDELFGQNPRAEVLVGEKGGQVVAFALFFHNFSTFLGKSGIYLEDLFVLPSFRGQGIGLQMLKKLAEIAKERHAGRLEWSVLNWNQKAIELYEKIGAKPMKGWTVYRLEGAGIQDLACSAQN